MKSKLIILLTFLIVSTTKSHSQSQTINGNLIVGTEGSNALGMGNKLILSGVQSNGDQMSIYRFNRQFNASDIRVDIGDDYGWGGIAGDRFVVGSTNWVDNTYYPFMTIGADGRVGIGSNNPTTLLDLKSTNPILSINTTVNNSFNGISFKQDDVEYSYLKYNTFSGELRMYANPQGFGGYTTFYNNNVESMRILANGNIGIGTTNPTSKLTVAGDINSREVKVTVNAGADFVFDKDYDLPSLDTVASYIKENKHLPEIASAKEMQTNGMNLSEMNIKLLQKIEELT